MALVLVGLWSALVTKCAGRVPMVWSTMRVGEWRDQCGDQRPEAGQGAEMVNHSAGKPANGNPGAACGRQALGPP